MRIRRVPAVVLAVLVIAVLPVEAQQMTIAPRLSGGVHSRDLEVPFTVTAELHAELSGQILGGYVGVGFRDSGVICVDTSPQECGVPRESSFEFTVGGTLSGETLVHAPLYFSVGVGAVSWRGRGWDPLLESESGVRIGPERGVGFVFGIRGTFIWISEQKRKVITSAGRFDAVALVVGLRFPIGR
jgi:hypothetical protein